MIDRCARPGCHSVKVSRDIDMRPLLRRWFCSPECSDIVNKPVHWLPPGRVTVACGAMNAELAIENRQWHRFTDDHLQATCCACKRTVVYKKRAGALTVS